jgi:threonine dehydrogenase-like Zn-dependent dehydrogenase
MIRLKGSTRVTVVDKNLSRAEYAGQLGADEIETSLDVLKRDFYDIVIDATGVPAVMQRTLEFVRYGGKILLFGVPPSGSKIELEAFPIFRKGLTILSSYTSVRNSYQAVDLIRSGNVIVTPVISHQVPLQDFGKGIELIEKGIEGVRKVIVCPNAS